MLAQLLYLARHVRVLARTVLALPVRSPSVGSSPAPRAMRPLVVAALVVAATALVATSASALTVSTTSVAHVGSGAARLTTYTNGTGKLYVNLKGLAPGTWNEHLWSGTCAGLGTRVAVLPGLAVPASGAIARTNVLTVAQTTGRTLLIVHGSQVWCATFGASAGPSPSPSPTSSASPTATASASPTATASASPTATTGPSPTASEDH